MDLATNRKLTSAFIAVRPVTVQLNRRARVETPGGGFKWAQDGTVPEQIFTIVELAGGGMTGLPRPTVTQDGVERTTDFQLVGEWDADIAVDDWFTHQGKTWEVVEIFFDNGYESRATVAARGR